MSVDCLCCTVPVSGTDLIIVMFLSLAHGRNGNINSLAICHQPVMHSGFVLQALLDTVCTITEGHVCRNFHLNKTVLLSKTNLFAIFK